MNKNIFIPLTLLLNTFIYPSQDQSILTVLLMVKNEETSIVKTLQPFIDGGLQQFVVLDTGSTDNTVEITQQLFSQHKLEQAYVIEQPFVDFSTSRNYLIDQAESLFPHTKFFAMADAEWYINNVQGLLKFCHDNINSREQAFYIALMTDYSGIKSHNEFFYLTRVFRAHRSIRFKYPVHEDIFVYPKKNIPKDVFYIYHPTKISHDRSIERNKQDVKMLLNALEQQPNDYRILYFLGQTYVNLGEYEKGCEFYKKAMSAVKDNEIHQRIHYKLAQIYEKINQWDTALYHYLESYNADQKKAEPLIRIANHYKMTNENILCYLFALYAADIKMPENEHVEQTLYTHLRHQLLSLSAWHVNEFNIGYQATQKALLAMPENENLKHNLEVYEQKIKSIHQ